MVLTIQDRNELLKAAVKADDLEELRRWLVTIVDVADAKGKGDTTPALPPFRPAGHETPPARQPDTQRYPAWGDGTLAGNGTRQ